MNSTTVFNSIPGDDENIQEPEVETTKSVEANPNEGPAEKSLANPSEDTSIVKLPV